VLPDHLHAVRKLPAADADFARRWNLIKAGFARAGLAAQQLSSLCAAGLLPDDWGGSAGDDSTASFGE
jgi:hypothetical protein